MEHNGPVEWRRTVSAQLMALVGRLWMETHPADPALKPHLNISSNSDEEEVGT